MVILVTCVNGLFLALLMSFLKSLRALVMIHLYDWVLKPSYSNYEVILKHVLLESFTNFFSSESSISLQLIQQPRNTDNLKTNQKMVVLLST